LGSNPIVNKGCIFQPVPDFFLAIETLNEPSPSVNPVINQGFKLKIFVFLSEDLGSSRFLESVLRIVVECSCLFRI